MMLRLFLFATALLMAAPAFAATGDMRVVVPNRDIARGEVISEADLVYGTIPANTVFSGIATSVDALSGMEARRMLRAHEIVRADDVRHPIVVTKGSIVTMTFEAPGVSLTASGRAMSEGGVGDTVTIQNPASFRQVSAVVTAPGAVRVSTAALTVSPSARMALNH
ncbi:MAG: flagellar basal body P-ring formation protein FlgA [Alphaproteobacteria bacterium]|nr:flagellar basal body P-ring formation protein FlgA [Alphaproteobacteria bacterium]MBV9418936.1 flagellar basal body P-ring formation protein FlgA [Alphaproteobacteria bacterium]MBV9539930.1 flagellar basal body P-ring formation protein FlgA [Alphaproteobacteria bacterium]MBV9904267.1 flagellar basal body P-ring formation protein FlgA [Alphaproteobacteria bacterium]